MNLTFKGKFAIVTGACGGIGLEVCKNLSNNNILVLMIDIKEPPKSFLMRHKNCSYKKIDYLINTTGVLWFNKDVSSTDINTKVWDKVYEINLKSMVYLSKIIIPIMKKNKFGSMVHISTIDALSGDDKPQDAYGSSKAAMIRLSKSLAIQFASDNIRSNCILPGAVDTSMQKRWKKNVSAKKKIGKNYTFA